MIQLIGFGSHLEQLIFSLKTRESEPSQVVVLCCLALFDASQICNHVQSRVAAGFSPFPKNIPKPLHHVYIACRYQIMHILYMYILFNC